MTKVISISPSEMLRIVAGAPIAPIGAGISEDAKVLKAGFNPKTNEFWMQVESESFDDTLKLKRFPQEFQLKTT